MHKTRRRLIKGRQEAARREVAVYAAMIQGLVVKEALIPAVAAGLDLWAWTQGSAQFVTGKQVSLAARYGLTGLIEAVFNGADSASAPLSALERAGYRPVVVETRCAVRRDDGGHSCWAYGPVFLSKEAAMAAGFTHAVMCRSCGCEKYPLRC